MLGVAAPLPFPPLLFLISLTTSSTRSSVHAASTELFRHCTLTSCDSWTPPAPPCHATRLSSRQRSTSTARTRLRTQLRPDADDVHPAIRRECQRDSLQRCQNSRMCRMLCGRNTTRPVPQRLRECISAAPPPGTTCGDPASARHAPIESFMFRSVAFSVSLTPPRRRAVQAAPTRPSMNASTRPQASGPRTAPRAHVAPRHQHERLFRRWSGKLVVAEPDVRLVKYGSIV